MIEYLNVNRITLLVMLFSCYTFADVHVIKFRSTPDVTYSNKVLKARVGDTIQWVGAFSTYPLNSTTVPQGAESWRAAEGKVFQYVVKVPGKYNYVCYPTSDGKRICTFDVTGASGSSANATTSPSFHLEGLMTDTASPDRQSIGYSVTVSQTIQLILYAEDGKPVYTLDEGLKAPGRYAVQLSNRPLAPGFYVCRLTGSDAEETLGLHLEKTTVKGKKAGAGQKFHIEE